MAQPFNEADAAKRVPFEQAEEGTGRALPPDASLNYRRPIGTRFLRMGRVGARTGRAPSRGRQGP